MLRQKKIPKLIVAEFFRFEIKVARFRGKSTLFGAAIFERL
jgi:hypothetical protein